MPLVATWHTDLLAYADVFSEIPVGAAAAAYTPEVFLRRLEAIYEAARVR